MKIPATLTNVNPYSNTKLSVEKQKTVSLNSTLSSSSGAIPTNSIRNTHRAYLLSEAVRYAAQNDATKNLINTYSEIRELSELFNSSSGETSDKIKNILESSDSENNHVLKEIQSQLTEQVSGYWKFDTIAIPATAAQNNNIATTHDKDSIKLSPELGKTYIYYSEEAKNDYIKNNQDDIMNTILSICAKAVEARTNNYTQNVNSGSLKPASNYDEYCEKTSLSGLGFTEIKDMIQMEAKAKDALDQLNIQLNLDLKTGKNLLEEAKKYGDIHFTYA